MTMTPFRLEPSFRERVWGRTDLSPWFPPTAEKTGEVWFTSNDNLTSVGRPLGDLLKEHGRALFGTGVAESDCCHLLVKFLFTSERLSVQVHPDDAYAGQHHSCRGKTEMWHMLRTEPGAAVALGFQKQYAPEEVRQAALSGDIEHMLRWVPVQAGDTYLAPAGTVHAIGAGIALCEIQQNSDVTYRLYDYGRPRELHLDRALDVSDLGPYTPQDADPRSLASCGYFFTERLSWTGRQDYVPDPERYHLLITLEGQGSLGDQPFGPGQVWWVPPSASVFPVAVENTATILRTYYPSS